MIVIDKIDKSFEGKVVFNDFSLKIDDGDFVVLCGESGSGKTTLLNMIGGIDNPDKGQIIVDDVDITKKKNKKNYYRKKVGFLFQNFALIENKTVRQNLELIEKNNRTDIKIEEALKSLGIYDLIDKKVYKLSGGEQQRVALARLMIKQCDIILADEPTGSLDFENGIIVMQTLHSFNNSGKTVVIVTHDKQIVKEEKNVVKIEKA